MLKIIAGQKHSPDEGTGILSIQDEWLLLHLQRGEWWIADYQYGKLTVDYDSLLNQNESLKDDPVLTRLLTCPEQQAALLLALAETQRRKNRAPFGGVE